MFPGPGTPLDGIASEGAVTNPATDIHLETFPRMSTSKIPPLLLMVLFAIAMLLATMLPPGSTRFALQIPLALTLLALSALLIASALTGFLRARTSVSPRRPGRASAIVTSGIYRLSRNPMYLGFILLLAAWAVILAHPLSAILVPIFGGCLHHWQILPEERVLEQKFGETFLDYKSRVRRWV
ncbi:isoprenylcysteine carboxyl methyltransferase [Pseudomonas matsuisoli]|uniref:Isoprenylcysteine carboxyl methyltransferase n=2 Tax=Pseudomonas matsuisoli TaxID=1515666 RepID=A0A917Q175_9PSED|nr:isoprenylcysteine carboxyl methyltransferase [Pseudomonas matsuisoli]